MSRPREDPFRPIGAVTIGRFSISRSLSVIWTKLTGICERTMCAMLLRLRKSFPLATKKRSIVSRYRSHRHCRVEHGKQPEILPGLARHAPRGRKHELRHRAG